MSDTFSVDWATAETSDFYSLDSGTYPAVASEVDSDQTTGENSANPGSPMVRVEFLFPEARVTKPKKGRPKGSNETEVVIEHDRRFPKYFTFSHPVSLGMAKEYLVAAGAATEDELEEQMDWAQIKELFDSTSGADVAVRMTKRPPKAKEAAQARPDKFGNINNIGNIFAKDSSQYATAAAAIGNTISKDKITFGGKKR